MSNKDDEILVGTVTFTKKDKSTASTRCNFTMKKDGGMWPCPACGTMNIFGGKSPLKDQCGGCGVHMEFKEDTTLFNLFMQRYGTT